MVCISSIKEKDPSIHKARTLANAKQLSIGNDADKTNVVGTGGGFVYIFLVGRRLAEVCWLTTADVSDTSGSLGEAPRA